MTDKEKIDRLIDLITDHCSWCADCEWYAIPDKGLVYEGPHENASCGFAVFWKDLAQEQNNAQSKGTRDEESITSKIKTSRCPSCFNTRCLEHIHTTDSDSDGVFENHIIRCTLCGRSTCAMDTFEDALEAFNGNDDTVYLPENTDSVLLRSGGLKNLVCRASLRDVSSPEALNMLDIRARG